MGVQSDIWKAIDDQRPQDMRQHPWRHSWEGLRTAMAHKGYKLCTTSEELAAMPLPKDNKGADCFMQRKVVVERDGVRSKPTRICGLLSGDSGLKTKLERAAIHDKVSENRILAQPKGIALNNAKESRASSDLDELIDVQSALVRRPLVELRIADVAYSLAGSNIEEDVFVSDQIKTARVDVNGSLGFHCGGSGLPLTAGGIRSILGKGMSLTCIGLSNEGRVTMVWFFDGKEALQVLEGFDDKLCFRPRFAPKRASSHPFTIAYNKPQIRFDVGSSSKECARLLARKVEAVVTGVKRSLKFLNEDFSQIPSEGNRMEQRSITMTTAACELVGGSVERLEEDASSCVDFRVDGNCRVQDKAIKTDDSIFNMRHKGKHPYNPDKVDVMQISNISTNIVYAVPMRLEKDGIVTSHFSAEELMTVSVKVSQKWKLRHSEFTFDFSTDVGRRRYVENCCAASTVPSLSDDEFYSSIIRDNADMFGSKRQLAALKTA